MNALVDDQLMRMRRALDSDAARQWLDANRRGGHRFYFGRYTGATPVTGSRETTLAVSRLRDILTETDVRSARAAQVASQTGDPDIQFFVPRLDGAEMRSRWDMIDAPPDVLVTNYSMLNVMLLRDRDQSFFASTRQWLDASPDNRFTLVVDELHTYRGGTAGTEVGYLLRKLKHRLGLDQRPDQLRILAASASLDAQRDQQYLEELFGVAASSFDFVEGELDMPDVAPVGGSDEDVSAILAADAEGVSPVGPRPEIDRHNASGIHRPRQRRARVDCSEDARCCCRRDISRRKARSTGRGSQCPIERIHGCPPRCCGPETKGPLLLS